MRQPLLNKISRKMMQWMALFGAMPVTPSFVGHELVRRQQARLNQLRVADNR